MNHRHGFILFGGLVLAALLWLAQDWFFANYELVPVEVYQGMQGEARRNPLLAAERLLRRMGTPVESLQAMPAHDQLAQQDSLIVLQREQMLSAEQTSTLLAWVRRGGHLIFTNDIEYRYDNADEVAANSAGTDAETEDELLRYLALRQYKRADHMNHETTRVEFPSTGSPSTGSGDGLQGDSLRVNFNIQYYLQALDDAAVAEEGEELPQLAWQVDAEDSLGAYLLHYTLEEGLITVCSDLSVLENDAIGKHDHAQFLWQLVNHHRAASRVWLARLTGSSMPSLWSLLWQHAPYLASSLGLLLLLWLWQASRRFGPLLPEPPLARRSWLEHIEASGLFLWRQGQVQRLLHSARQPVLQRIAATHPAWQRLPRSELSQLVSDLCGQPAAAVEAALFAAGQPTEPEFTTTLQTLQMIQKAL